MAPPGWTEPPWSGWIETTGDALLILEAARRGIIPRVTRRLVDAERRMITSGSVFVFDEDESGIKRWTDGFYWSPSRILGNFLLYRETDKKGAGHGRRKGTNANTVEEDGDAESGGGGAGESLSRPRNEMKHNVDRHRERTLMGSLTNNYKFKPDGLMKKTFSLSIAGVAQHLISYYKVSDVESGRLRAPSSLPELATLEISPTLLERGNFRCPPKTEVGIDGVPRYRGEADEVLAAGLDLGLGGVAAGGRRLGAVARTSSVPMTTTRAATRNPSDGAMNGATMNGATMNGGRHASIGQGHEGDVGNMKGREGGGEQDEEDDDAEGDDDSYGDGDETEDGVEDPRDVVKEEGKGKGVGREVLLDFSIVSAAASVNQKPATGTGTNATATANSAPPGPAPATTAGQKPPKIKRTSPHTKPSDLASATRTLASTRSALGEPLANSLVHVSHAPIPRGRTNPTPFTTSPIESLDPMYTGGGTKRARQSETGAPPTKRARSTSVSMGHATAPTHPAPPPQNAPSRQAYGQPHPQQVYMASPRLVPTGAEPYSLSYSPPHPQAQPQTQTTIQPQPPQYTPASSSSSSLAAAAAAYSQQFAQGAGAGGSGQQQQGQRGPEQHQQTGGGHRQATSPAPQGGGQQAYSPYPYPWYYTTAPAGGAWSPYGAAPASAPSAPFPHVPAQPRPPLAQGRPPSAYAHPSPSLAQHTLHTQPRVSQARYAPPEDAGMEDAAPESEEGADEDYEDGEDGDEGVGDGG